MTAFAKHAAIGFVVASVVGAGAAAPAEAALWPFSSDATDQGTAPAEQPPAAQTPAVAAAGAAPARADGDFTGKPFDAYYGNVQVKVTIAAGQIQAIDVPLFPKDRRTSRYINSQALPILKSEVIAAQNTEVDMVSGATLTSEAFIRSLRSALKQAVPGT